ELLVQTVPRPTLLVNSKTHGKVALRMTFEGAKGQVCSLVNPTRVALEIGRCRINQQSHDLLYIRGDFRRLYPVGTNSKSMSCWGGSGSRAGRLKGWGR